MAKEPEISHCVFSEETPVPLYRYVLRHTWRDPKLPDYVPSKWAMWIGVNPSTADESSLDPTLRRVRAFSKALGCDGFLMTNLFALRSTDPKGLLAVADPIGPDNDRHLLDCASKDGVTHIVAAWGVNGTLNGRDRQVIDLLKGKLSCLGVTKAGLPRHPLYVKGDTSLQPFPPLAAPLVLDTPPQPV